MALYALNLFDLEDNDLYLRYSRRSPEAVAKHGGKLVALGRLEEALKGEEGAEARKVMILVEWPSPEAFREFLDDPDLKDLQHLHEGGTRNYLWWTYERLEDLRPLFQTQSRAEALPVVRNSCEESERTRPRRRWYSKA